MPSKLSVHHIGIDVSRDTLDVYCLEQDHYFQVENNEKGFKHLIKQLPVGAKVLFEATGKLERPAAIALDKKDFRVCIVNPRRTFHYAKSKGTLAKTDKIDSKMLAAFLKDSTDLRFGLASKTQFKWGDYEKRRSQLKKLITQEKNRLKRTQDTWLKKQTEQHIGQLSKQLAALEAKLKTMIEKDESAYRKFKLVQTIPGIGEKIALTIVTALPELGKIDKKALSKLVGIAPIPRDSGKWSGKRSIYGGRQDVRNALYMGALVGMNYHKTIRPYYNHLLSKGKPKKVALVACMNKLLRIIHSVILHDKPFEYI